MIPSFMAAGGQQNVNIPEQKSPGQFKSREEVIEATKIVQPEIIEPQHIMHRMALVFQFSAMGIVDKPTQTKLNKIAKYSFLSLFGGFGLAIGGWKIGNLLFKGINRRVRVLGRSLFSLSFFFLPQKLLYNYVDNLSVQLHQDYKQRFIQFMLTANPKVLQKQQQKKQQSEADSGSQKSQ